MGSLICYCFSEFLDATLAGWQSGVSSGLQGWMCYGAQEPGWEVVSFWYYLSMGTRRSTLFPTLRKAGELQLHLAFWILKTNFSSLKWSSTCNWHSATGWLRRQSHDWCGVGTTVLCSSWGNGLSRIYFFCFVFETGSHVNPDWV